MKITAYCSRLNQKLTILKSTTINIRFDLEVLRFSLVVIGDLFCVIDIVKSTRFDKNNHEYLGVITLLFLLVCIGNEYH